MKTITLDQLKPGERAKVRSFNQLNIAYRQKLLTMGLTPGVELALIRRAPLGDPLQISVRGFELTLRKNEAKRIEIELLP